MAEQLTIRAGNTEPVMRIIVEANDRPTAEKYIDQVATIRAETLVH